MDRTSNGPPCFSAQLPGVWAMARPPTHAEFPNSRKNRPPCDLAGIFLRWHKNCPGMYRLRAGIDARRDSPQLAKDWCRPARCAPDRASFSLPSGFSWHEGPMAPRKRSCSVSTAYQSSESSVSSNGAAASTGPGGGSIGGSVRMAAISAVTNYRPQTPPLNFTDTSSPRAIRLQRFQQVGDEESAAEAGLTSRSIKTIEAGAQARPGHGRRRRRRR